MFRTFWRGSDIQGTGGLEWSSSLCFQTAASIPGSLFERQSLKQHQPVLCVWVEEGAPTHQGLRIQVEFRTHLPFHSVSPTQPQGACVGLA